MRINGKQYTEPHIELIPIFRGGDEIMFQAQAVLSYDDFDKLCPRPQPPKMLRKGVQSENTEDPEYKAATKEWFRKRTDWMFLQSISVTPDLEWETIDMGNPETWGNFMQELRDSKFSEAEISALYSGVWKANTLDEERVKEARDRFYAGRQSSQDQLFSPTTDPVSTPSGEPVKDSTSSLQTSATPEESAGTT